MRHWIVLALVGSAFAALQGCNHSNTNHGSHGVEAQQEAHSGSPHEPDQTAHSRPTNQVAVLTVWAEANASAANFENASLRYADMSYANLDGAKVKGANLFFANLHAVSDKAVNWRAASTTAKPARELPWMT